MKILKIIQIFFFIFLLNTGCEKKEQKVQTNVGLLYDQNAKYGVGGIAVSLHW